MTNQPPKLANVYQISEDIIIPKGSMVVVRERDSAYFTIEAAIIKGGVAQFAPPACMRDALFAKADIPIHNPAMIGEGA